jgi:hypothetical protein
MTRAISTTKDVDLIAFDNCLTVYEFNEVTGGFDVNIIQNLKSLGSLSGQDEEQTESCDCSMSYDSICFDDEVYDCDSLNVALPSRNAFPLTKSPRKVSFGPVIVREYTVVIGCQDIPCPLELGWDYSEHTVPCDEDYRLSLQPHRYMHRLTYQERKASIAISNNILASDVKFLEQEMLALRISRLNNGIVHRI